MTDGAAPLAPTGKRANRDAAFEVAFGQRIRVARIAAHMSQTDLGQCVGISCQQMQKYEMGKDRVSVGTLQAIADALGVSPSSFFIGEAPFESSSVKEMRQAQRLGDRIARLKDPTLVRRLMALIDALADNDELKGRENDHFLTSDDLKTVSSP